MIAENELLGAAASIEAAARKLAELKPKPRPKVTEIKNGAAERLCLQVSLFSTKLLFKTTQRIFGLKRLVSQKNPKHFRV